MSRANRSSTMTLKDLLDAVQELRAMGAVHVEVSADCVKCDFVTVGFPPAADFPEPALEPEEDEEKILFHSAE